MIVAYTQKQSVFSVWIAMIFFLVRLGRPFLVLRKDLPYDTLTKLDRQQSDILASCFRRNSPTRRRFRKEKALLP